MFAQIQEAARRLRGRAHITPIMTCRTLDQRVGAAVFLKCESFQRTGSFKFRGAFNAISQLPAVQKARGVVTFSSGNHAQAVALSGRLLGVAATVVMPANAPAIKRAASEGYGASVIEYDPRHDDREAIAHRLEVAQGCSLIPPFDHPAVIAGQGTAALELLQSVPPLDMLLVPCGGGGLLSGSAIAAKGLCPACRVVGIEPALADDATRSFHSGRLQSVHNPATIADGTRTASLGRLTFPLLRQYVDDMRTVSEEAIMAAVRFLFHRMKLVVEPSGALGAAALLSGVVRPRGRTGVILSGGNIDAATMIRILRSGDAEEPHPPAPAGT
jgi:threonine dehydratase